MMVLDLDMDYFLDHPVSNRNHDTEKRVEDYGRKETTYWRRIEGGIEGS